MTTTSFVKTLKRCVAVLLFAPALATAAAVLPLDRAPVSNDPIRLQNGAKLFVNYCMGCHSASFMRYNMLTGIGLTEEQITDNLIFSGGKVGDLMTIAMRPADGKAWFGAPPPDLTLVARQRNSAAGSGADWLYTYLRQFYRDPERPTGWNNPLFPNVGMPHVLWQLQGDQVAATDEQGNITLSLAKPGTMTVEQYDEAVADLVSFLSWMSEPIAEKRKNIGYFVLLFLAGMFVLSYALKKNYWRDVH